MENRRIVLEARVPWYNPFYPGKSVEILSSHWILAFANTPSKNTYDDVLSKIDTYGCAGELPVDEIGGEKMEERKN